MDAAAQIARNYQHVRDRIAAACDRAGRPADSVRLVAVTKYAELEWVRELVALGVSQLAESRPQQLVQRAAELPSTVEWHLIGHLQRNKARRVLPLVTLIHSVDSLRLLQALDRLAEELDSRPRVLLELNLSGEATKDGMSAEALRENWPQIAECRRVQIQGLMTMAPLTPVAEDARPVFRQLRQLREELPTASLPLPELSMGMSHDFEIGIEEGATLVRVGSDLFAGLTELPR